MSITALIVSLSVFLMYYRTVGNVPLAVICITVFILMNLVKSKEKDHEKSWDIDIICRKSRLYSYNTEIKTVTAFIMIILSIVSGKPVFGFIILMISMITVVVAGGLDIKTYIGYLSIPAVFIFLGVIAILINAGGMPDGVINLKIGNSYIKVLASSQIEARKVVFKALGAVSSLYIISLTTSISQITGSLKKLHLPSVFIDLMYLMYRCIFIIFTMHHVMKVSAASRQGFSSYRKSVKTTGKIYAGLLFRSYKKANRLFDSMESRLYSGEIGFLERD